MDGVATLSIHHISSPVACHARDITGLHDFDAPTTDLARLSGLSTLRNPSHKRHNVFGLVHLQLLHQSRRNGATVYSAQKVIMDG